MGQNKIHGFTLTDQDWIGLVFSKQREVVDLSDLGLYFPSVNLACGTLSNFSKFTRRIL